MYLPRNVVVLVCLVLTFVASVFGQNTKVTTNVVLTSDCDSQRTCAKCISTPHCKWCSEVRPQSKSAAGPDAAKQRPRCVDSRRVNDNTNWCSLRKIVNPASNQTIEKNDWFSDVLDKQVQLRPQRVKVLLRAGQTQTVKIQYKQAVDYPVDLYFLMDLSFSMEFHRVKLSKLGKQLSNAMKNLTRNFRLGFGSFVDKYILPMTSTQPEWLQNHCKLKNGDTCAKPYDYKHQMSLTDDDSKFEQNVIDAPISGNIDSPEGGLDALMQAMVCGDKIGWRNKARHILVYSSDATYHIAGDGRLAGLVEPNDELCHLNENGFYDHAEILDYPSISQINRVARDNNMNIIFAVTQDVVIPYTDLSSVINGSLCGTLDDKSENVVSLVKSHSEKLTKSIKIVDNSSEEIFQVKYFSKCLNKGASIRERNECDGIRVDTPIEFEVSIKALECPEKPEDRRHTIAIQPEGVDEKVLIDVELICDCDCSQDDKRSSSYCTGHGDLVCGICDCHKGYQREYCQCEIGKMEDESHRNSCRSADNQICSGNGECNSCGVCVCTKQLNPEHQFYGDLCECDNFMCQSPPGSEMPCGGQTKGECKCGKCKCKDSWTGPDCGCSTSNASCIDPNGDGKECNGVGECKCGKCDCVKDSRWSGKYCQNCPTCPNQFCDEYKDCVECLAYGTGPVFEKEGRECPSCSLYQLQQKVDKIDENSTDKICPTPDSTGCTFVFSYTEENERNGRSDTPIVFVNAEREKKCAKPSGSPWAIAGSAIALTLFLGLLGLIIWKVLTMYHDHREWVKFEKERVSANWERGENPLFKEPTTSFKNPTFDSQDTK